MTELMTAPERSGLDTSMAKRPVTATPAKMLLIVAALALSACAASDDRYVAPKHGRQAITQKVISATDWTKAQKLTVYIDEFGFSPELPTLEVGKPYKLKLVNEGLLPHAFTAGEFLAAIAAQRLTMPNGEASMPFLESISIEPNTEKTLIFVPTLPGRYEFNCDQPFHKKFGMTGSVTVTAE